MAGAVLAALSLGVITLVVFGGTTWVIKRSASWEQVEVTVGSLLLKNYTSRHRFFWMVRPAQVLVTSVAIGAMPALPTAQVAVLTVVHAASVVAVAAVRPFRDRVVAACHVAVETTRLLCVALLFAILARPNPAVELAILVLNALTIVFLGAVECRVLWRNFCEYRRQRAAAAAHKARVIGGGGGAGGGGGRQPFGAPEPVGDYFAKQQHANHHHHHHGGGGGPAAGQFYKLDSARSLSGVPLPPSSSSSSSSFSCSPTTTTVGRKKPKARKEKKGGKLEDARGGLEMMTSSTTVKGSSDGASLAKVARDTSALFDSQSSLDSSAWLSMSSNNNPLFVHVQHQHQQRQEEGEEEGEVEEETAGVRAARIQGGRGGAAATAAAAAVQECSPRFLEYFDGEGSAYYHCPADGTTVWELPPIADHLEWVRLVESPLAGSGGGGGGGGGGSGGQSGQGGAEAAENTVEFLVASPRRGGGASGAPQRMFSIGKDVPH